MQYKMQDLYRMKFTCYEIIYLFVTSIYNSSPGKLNIYIIV